VLCAADKSCPDGPVCDGMRCGAPAAQCVKTADCPAERVCSKGLCLAGEVPRLRRRLVPHRLHEELPVRRGGLVCENGACAQPLPACVTDCDCPWGQTCRAGACVSPAP